MSKKDIFILAFIIIIAFILRLYNIATPLADLHSWRQADTAAVSRNYIRDGIDLLHPRYDDLSGRESGRENPQGYRMVEFPIYNAIIAFLYKLIPSSLPLEAYGRLVSIFSSLVIIAILYFLLQKESGRLSAVAAALTYAVYPFFIFFSRVILPETTALAFLFISIFLLYHFKSKKISTIKESLFFAGSASAFALSILIKPTTIFYLLVPVYFFWQKYGFKFIQNKKLYLYFFISVMPFALWRFYIRSFPEGIPVNDWLITSVNTYQGLKNIFFRPAFFRWIFFERINNLILGGFLSVFLILGVIRKYSRFYYPVFLLSTLIYLFTFQGGNVQHEYYQTIILPSIAMFIGLGVDFIFQLKKSFLHPFFLSLIVISLFLFSFYFSFYKVRDYYNYPQDLPQIAKIIKTLTQKEDKIVTDTTGDTTLLYLSDRKGAPSLYKDPQTLKKLGYKYLIIFNKVYAQELKQIFEVVFENDKFVMFKFF